MNRKNTRKIKRKMKSKKGGTYESYLATSTHARNPSRLTAQRASRVIQRALQQSVKKSKIKAFSKKRASKKIQKALHTAFDFKADDCAVCLEKKFVRSKVSPLSCHSKHGLHTKCLNDLLKSERFRTENNRKCPMCKAPAAELQNVPEVEEAGQSEEDLEIQRQDRASQRLNNQVREIVDHFIILREIPRELNNAANIENFKLTCIDYITEYLYENNITPAEFGHRLVQLIRIQIDTVLRYWNYLKSDYDTINRSIRTRSGTIKTRIGDTTLIPIRDNFFAHVLVFQRLLSQFGMEIPDIMITQIQEIRTILNSKPHIGQPANELIHRIEDEQNRIYNEENSRM